MTHFEAQNVLPGLHLICEIYYFLEARVISDLKTINDFAVTQFAEKAQYDPAIEEEKLDLSADLICKICNSKSASLPTLRRHMSDMHGEEKFQCDQCSFKTRRKPSLKNHILVEHKGHRLHCDRCEKAFTRKVLQRIKLKH